MAEGRGLLRQILQNFINSLKPKTFWGELKGKDSLGTEYYEAPSLRSNKPSRWFLPRNPVEYTVENPPEWEAWLRHRRKEAPTEEEIFLNAQKRLAVIEKAKRLEKPKTGRSDEEIKVFDKPAFPAYKDYECPFSEHQNKQGEEKY